MTARAKLLGWCVCANISDHIRGGPDQSKFYQGTRMFAPGKKVYLGTAYWGTGGNNLHVIGLRRVSKELVNCVVEISTIENIRTVSIYSEKRWEKLVRLRVELFSREPDAIEYKESIDNALKNWRPEKLAAQTKKGPWGKYEANKYRKL